MKTATFLIAAILVFAPFTTVQAAPPADFETEIATLKAQIQLLETRLAKLEAGEKKVLKEKKIITKKNKRMDKNTAAGSVLPQSVIDLDAKWAERETELDAKYKTPGKWKLVDEKGIKEYKKYQEKRESLLKD